MLKGKRKSFEQQMVEDYIKDMQASQEQGALEAQAKEFKTFLESKATGKNEFFKNMLRKMNDGVILTENMVNAIRKCMKQQAEWDAQKQQAQSGTPVVIARKSFRMKSWWCKSNNLDTLVITCDIEVETQKALKVNAHGAVAKGTWCMRCGQELTQLGSIAIGFGEHCASEVGVPYPGELNTLSKKEKAKLKKQLVDTVRKQVYVGWLPKSAIVEEVEVEED